MVSEELKSYGEYKNSDLLWLDKVPLHWEMIRNKNVMQLQKNTVGSLHHNYTLLSLTLNGIIPRDMENAKGKFPKDFDTYQIVNVNNLVFCLFDMDETPRTVGLSSLNGMITGAYSVFKLINTNEKYLYYYYLSLDSSKLLKPLYTGLRKTISTDTFLRTKLPIPPRPEQDQIVKYLDFKLAKINKFIKAKKKLIAVLKEQIECYLFGNEDKTNNIEIKSWDTAFPDNWTFIKSNRLTTETNIKNMGDRELLAVTQDRGVVYKKDCEQNYVSPSGDLSGLKLVSSGDFVISLRSFQGGIEFSEIEGLVSPAYTIFCLNENYSSYNYKIYYKYLFKTRMFISVLNTLISGIRDGKNINYIDFAKLTLPIPPKETVDKVTKLIKQLESIKRQFEKEVVLLTEYRTRLISDVVTGKVDVRGIAIDETGSVEPDLFEGNDEEVEANELGEDELYEEVGEE